MKAIAAKTSVFLFFLYLMWYKDAYHHVQLFLYGGTALVAVTTLLYINHRPLKCLIPPKGLLFWAGFGIYSLLAGLVVASNRGLLVSSLITYMAFLFVCYCVAIICVEEKDIYWLLNVILVVCCICAIYTLFFGKPYQNGIYVTTMGPNNNPNSLGVLMIFGMCSILYRNERKLGGVLITLATVILFTYVIILTGSRKSLIGAISLVLLWIVPFLKDAWNNYKKTEKLLRIFLVLVAVAIGIGYFLKSYANTASFQRMLKLFTGGSSTRGNMYIEAIELFKGSMLFGIGFDQYRVLSSFQTYSHSTYAEVLACGGIFGCLIYFTPIVWTGYLICKKAIKEKTNESGVILALYVVEIFLGSVNIYLYTSMHMLLWTILYVWVENPDISRPRHI